MSNEKIKLRLKEVINGLIFVPETVFQFDLDRNSSAKHLHDHPEIPFILRSSSQGEYFSMDSRTTVEWSFQYAMISLQENEFKVGTSSNGVFTAKSSLEEYIQKYWDPEQKRMIFDAERTALAEVKGKEAWEQFKFRQQQNPEHKIAVLSTQSLDEQKIALPPEKLHSYAQKNTGLQRSGAGHTGFAMAMALNAPFVVLRSKANRAESNGILKSYIGDNGLIIVTGHGSPGGDEIMGSYDPLNIINPFNFSQAKVSYKPQIEREPKDIVSTAMDAGLKSGNHITIVLSICYGALETSVGTGDSFAHKLAREFAAKGISSTIIASDKQTYRFGTNAIIDEKITFNNKMGMAAEDVHVFTTAVSVPNSNPQINMYKPNETIQLTKNGVRFLNSNTPQTSLTNNTQAAQHVGQQGAQCIQMTKEIKKPSNQETVAQSNKQTKEKSSPKQAKEKSSRKQAKTKQNLQQVQAEQNLQQAQAQQFLQQAQAQLYWQQVQNQQFLQQFQAQQIWQQVQGQPNWQQVQGQQNLQQVQGQQNLSQGLEHFGFFNQRTVEEPRSKKQAEERQQRLERRNAAKLVNEQNLAQHSVIEESSTNGVNNRSNCM